jgi:hypothetical protein
MKRPIKPPSFKGRKHTEETREKMRQAHRKIQLAKRKPSLAAYERR